MEQLKCKNCRAKIDPDEIAFGVVRCKYCGYTFTWLKKSVEQSVMIDLQMGEDELSACDFNRAHSAYKRASEADKSEPEAYFGMALAENKVQYIKDAVKDRLQPICHEVAGRKFSDNPNYKKALSLATPEQKIIYESRAQEIDYIQQEFASLSQNCPKYDCFICVKVTKDDGKHTEDSFVAGQLYQKLKEDGYHPFYSEEEIGNRRGADYEAMILYALYTSPCMLLVCFDEEHLKTKWVKNEYTRFVSLRADDKEKKDEPKIALVYKNEEPRRLSSALSKVVPVNYDGAYAYSQICDFVSSFAGKTEEVKKRLNRKALAIALSAVATVGLVGGGVAIALGKNGGDPSGEGVTPALEPVEYTLSANGELSSVRLNGNKTLNIPSEIDGKKVFSISASAFKGNKEVEEVTLPEGVTSIDAEAFKDCTALKKLELPESLATLGAGAFVNCSSLTELVLPSSVTYQAEGLLFGCSSLNSLTASFNDGEMTFGGFFGTEYFTGGVLTIQNGKNYYVPSSLKIVAVTGDELPEYAFYRCSNLTDVSLSEQILDIGNSTFQGCSSLATVSLSSTLSEVGENAFSGCSSLRAVTLPKTVESVGDRAFADCSSLTKAEILGEPTLGETLFAGCGALTEAVLPFSSQPLVEYFGTDEFDNSVAVQTLARAVTYYLPSDLAKLSTVGESIVENAFANCSKLSQITFDLALSEVGDYAFANCALISEVVFNQLDGVGDFAFYNCTGLSAIAFESVGEFGENAFEGCSALTKTTVSSVEDWIKASFATPTSNPVYYARELYVQDGILSELSLPATVSEIPSYAFYNCTSLRTVNAGANLQVFGESAFYGCENLQTTNVESISAWCEASFANAESNPVSVSGNISQNSNTLTRVEITVPVLSGYAFYGADCLKTVEISNSVTALSQYSLNGLSSLEELIFNAPNLADFTENNGVFTGLASQTKSFTLSVGENVQRIPAYLLSGSSGEENYLSSIEFTGTPTLKEVGANAFGQTSKLTSLSLPQSVESISVGALSGCSALQELSLPFVGVNKNGAQSKADLFGSVFGEKQYENSVATNQTYGEENVTYYLPTALARVTITGGALTDYVFSGCKSLTEVTLPSSVTEIPIKAFFGCQNLERVRGVEKVKTVSERAFEACVKFSHFEEFKDLESIENSAFRDCQSLRTVYFPDCLIEIAKGAFSGCSSVEEVSMRFVGGFEQSEASESSLFGYIFGDESFEGATQTAQYYASGSSVYYYVPDGLTKVQVRGDAILYGAFMNCKNIQEIDIFSSVTKIESSVFNNMTGVEKATFPYVFTHGVGFSSALKEIHVTGGTIPSQAFYQKTSLEKVIIDEDTLIVEDNYGVFYNCSSLTEVSLPSTWKSLGSSTFYNCKKLENITLPENLESIGNYIFSGCVLLKTIKLPANTATIPMEAFNGCKALESVDLSEATKITSVGAEAFQHCSSLKELTLPQTVGFIGQYAFYGCSSLTKTNVPKSVTSVERSAYQYTSSLEELIWEAESCEDFYSYTHDTFCGMGTSTANGTTLRFTPSVKRMPGNMFYFDDQTNLPKLYKVIFDENSSMEEFGRYAISEYYLAIEEFRLPDSIFAMDEYRSFYFAPKGVKNCYIPSLENWCQSSFGTAYYENLIYYAENLYIEGKLLTTSSEIVIPSSVEKISDRAFSGIETLRKVVISDGVKEIGEQAFYGTGITQITIPSSLTTVEQNAFSYLEYSGVKVLISDINAWSKINFANTEANPLRITNAQLLLNGTLVTSVTSDVEEIGSFAFYGYSKLETVSLPTGVNKVGDSAFYNCKSLKNLSLSEGLTHIGANAFKDCIALTGVDLPDSVATLGDGVFVGCSGLTAISLPSGLASLPNYFAQNCVKLQAIDLPQSVTTIGEKAFDGCNALKKIELNENITELGAGAFANTTGVEEIVWNIGELSVWSSSLYVFEGAGTSSGLKLTVKDNAQELPSYLMLGVKTPLSVVIEGSTLTKINSCAFYVDSVESVTVDNLDVWLGITFSDDSANPLSVGAKLIIDGQTVTELNGLENVTVNAYAFYGYEYLEKIHISDGVSVGTNAFRNCENLGEVYWNTSSLLKNSLAGAGTANNSLTLTVGKDVAELSDDYANGMTALYEVKFEEGSELKGIGKQAFYGCTSLAKFTAPESLESIGMSAFYNCTSLNNLAFSENLVKVGSSAFSGCTALENIEFGAEKIDNVTSTTFKDTPYRNNSLHQGVFYFKGKILDFEASLLEPNLVIPENVTGQYSVSFASQTVLETVVFPEGYLEIGDRLFYNCGLTSVELPSDLQTIGEQAFYGSAFTEISFPETLVSIGNSAFANCANLETVSFNEGLTSIGSNAFLSCSLLTGVTLPQTLESVGDYAFKSCGTLSAFEMKNPETMLGAGVFDGTQFKTGATVNGFLYIGTALVWADPSVVSGEVTVREGTTSIAGSAFKNCTEITAVTIPGTVENIGKEAFYQCTSLASVTFEGESALTELGAYAFYCCSKLTEIIIPDGVQKIRDYTFYSCTSLENVEIPQTVTELGEYAFYSCKALVTVALPQNLEVIEKHALSNCSKLTEIQVPNTVQIIGAKAFAENTALTKINLPNATYESYTDQYNRYVANSALYNCIALTDVTLSEEMQVLPENIFYGCKALTSIALPIAMTGIDKGAFYGSALASIDLSNITSIGANAFNNCDSLTEVALPEGLTSLGGYAFYDCDGLKTVTLPSTLTELPTYAFAICDVLATVNFSEGLTKIGSYAFSAGAITEISLPSTLTTIESYGLSSNDFTSIILPEGLTSLGSYAFNSCASLTEIAIPEKIRYINDSTFRYCSALTSVTMKNVEHIYSNAFSNCSSLANVDFGDKLERIEKNAFYKCGLQKIYFPASVTYIAGYAFQNCNSLGRVTFEDPTGWQFYNSLYGWRDFDVMANQRETCNKITLDYGLKKVVN